MICDRKKFSSLVQLFEGKSPSPPVSWTFRSSLPPGRTPDSLEEKSVDCSSELEVVKREHQNSKGDERRRSKRGQELRVPPRRGKRGRPKQRGFQMSVPGDSVCRRQLKIHSREPPCTTLCTCDLDCLNRRILSLKLKVKSLSCVRLFATLWAVACTRILHPWDFLGKSTGVGCHFLLQGIFSTQGSNPGLPHCRQKLYHLSHQGSPW